MVAVIETFFNYTNDYYMYITMITPFNARKEEGGLVISTRSLLQVTDFGSIIEEKDSNHHVKQKVNK